MLFIFLLQQRRAKVSYSLQSRRKCRRPGTHSMIRRVKLPLRRTMRNLHVRMCCRLPLLAWHADFQATQLMSRVYGICVARGGVRGLRYPNRG